MSIDIGILGFAHGHVNRYCQQWRDQPRLGVRVVAGWDHKPDRLAEAAKTHNIEMMASAEALLSRKDIKAVVIAAETVYHADLVEQAASAGKAIIVQKPLALTLEQAERIVEAVNHNGVPFTVAWQMRVDKQNLEIKRLIKSGAIGRIFMARRRHGLSTHQWDWFADSWHVKPELNRGMWADDASHAIDFLLWLFGEPVSVTAEIDTLLNPKVPDDNGIAIYRYGDGMMAEVVSSFTCPAGENTVEVIGEKGVIIQNFGDGPSCNIPRPPGSSAGLKWYSAIDKKWHVSDIPTPENHGARIADLAEPLAEFLNGKRPALATAQEGQAALKMTLAAYDSAAQGKRVLI